jgi:hypothetical protein
VAWAASFRSRGALALGQFVLNVRPALLDAQQALLGGIQCPGTLAQGAQQQDAAILFMV